MYARDAPDKITEIYENGFERVRYEDYTNFYITIQNLCNKAIKVVGYSRAIYPDGVKYSVVTRSFKAKYFKVDKIM
jgi:hypothetical protein